MITFGSLFAGIGGFDLGFERAGMVCKWQVEINEFCRKVLAKHWPAVTRWDDVKTFPPEPVQDWRVDVICGGDPCQENSAARSGDRTSQPSLGADFIKVVAAIRPRAVVRENPAVVRPDAPWPWWRFRDELERLGYTVLPCRLRSCCFGADHKRERLFLLAEMGNPNRVEQRLGGRVELSEGGEGEGDLGIRPYQPEPPRVAHGVPYQMDRNRALGNAVDPSIAEMIGNVIVRNFSQET
jgi:DNA (cytosine-5)-methyltransferase 1